MPVVFLNHDFVTGMAHRNDLDGVLVDLADIQRRLGPAPLYVHPELHGQDTGQGPFVAWANKQRSNPEQRRTIELLLRLCQGPFVTDLDVDAEAPEQVQPSLPLQPNWRHEAIVHLGHHVLANPQILAWLLSYDPQSNLKDLAYSVVRGDDRANLENHRQGSTTSSRLGAIATQGLAGALAILERAAENCPRLVVLDRARDSARRWTLDCTEQTLYHALVSLEVYANALDEGLSRELAAERYTLACSVQMSRESAQVGRSPSCRGQREIEVPGRGKQYFDMHAKPGGTRIHIWTEKHREETVVYIGHCGEHLLLPGKR